MSPNDSTLLRLNKLIAKGDAVGQTHKATGLVYEHTPTLSFRLFTEWQIQTLTFLQDIVGTEHTYSTTFRDKVNRAHVYDLQIGQGILSALKEDLLTDTLKVNHGQDDLSNVCRICLRFHVVVSQLSKRYLQRPTLVDVKDEYDVQDLMHSLLRLFFEDVRPEEWTPSYAGKSSRMDFLLKNEAIVIEVKKTRTSLSGKEIGTQLIDDIARYRTHPGCDTLVCFVYDPDGMVSNPRGLETDLSRDEDGLRIKVLIAPREY